MVFGSILPWSKAHHERNWFVYTLRGDRLRIEGDYARSRQFYEAALLEAETLHSLEKKNKSRNDLIDLQQLSTRKIISVNGKPADTTVKKSSGNSHVEETSRNPREVLFDWESFETIRDRHVHHSSKRTDTSDSMYSVMLTKEKTGRNNDAASFIELGDCNMVIGHFAEAESLYRRAQKAGESKDIILKVAAIDRIAESQWAQEQFAQALESSKDAISLAEKSGLNTTISPLKLHQAQILMQQDEFDEAEKLCRTVLKEKTISAANQWYPLLLQGECETRLHHFAKAIETLKSSMKIIERNYSAQDLRLKRICMSLAEAYVLSGQEEKAKPLILKAIKIFRSDFSSRRSDDDTMVARQGHLYNTVYRYDMAAFCYKWTGEMRAKKFGSNHFKVGVMLSRQALALEQLGDYVRAKALRKEAQKKTEGKNE